MAIEATCPTCKTQFNFTDDYAGRMLLCRNCKNTFAIPSPGDEVQPVTPPPPSRPIMTGIERDEPFVPNCYVERMTAARICLFFGIIGILGALAFGSAAFFFSCLLMPAKLQAAWNIFVMAIGCLAGFCVVTAILYICCGSCIREGGMIATWIMLVLTSIQLISSICSLGYQIFQLGNLPANLPGRTPIPVVPLFWTAFIVGCIFLMIHVKLFFCLSAIVNQPRSKRRPLPSRTRIPAAA